MINVNYMIFYWLFYFGLIIPILCYVFSYCLRKILTCKVAKNRYTNLIPLFSVFLGILIITICEYVIPSINEPLSRIIVGVLFGLSATGMHQLKKRLKLFFILKELDKKH